MRSGSTNVGSIDAVLVHGDADGAGHGVSLLVGLAVGLRARRGSRETAGAVPMGGGDKKRERRKRERESGNETAL